MIIKFENSPIEKITVLSITLPSTSIVFSMKDNNAIPIIEEIVKKYFAILRYVSFYNWDDKEKPYYEKPSHKEKIQYSSYNKLYNALYRIVIESRGLNLDNNKYENAPIWFHKIIMGLLCIEIEDVFTPLEKCFENFNDKDNNPVEKIRGNKEKMLMRENEKIKTLKISKNPYIKYEFADDLNFLIDLAISHTTEPKKRIMITLWKNFLKAYVDHIKNLRENFDVITVRPNDNFYTLQLSRRKNSVRKLKIDFVYSIEPVQ
jgi:hypothetical protein